MSFLKEAIETEKKWFESNLKKGYSIINIEGSDTNGISIYVTVSKDGHEEKPFKFRISDHMNGNSPVGITDMSLSYQVQGRKLYSMYQFYDDMSKEEAFLKLHEDNITRLKSLGKEQSSSYKASLKIIQQEKKELLKQPIKSKGKDQGMSM